MPCVESSDSQSRHTSILFKQHHQLEIKRSNPRASGGCLRSNHHRVRQGFCSQMRAFECSGQGVETPWQMHRLMRIQTEAHATQWRKWGSKWIRRTSAWKGWLMGMKFDLSGWSQPCKELGVHVLGGHVSCPQYYQPCKCPQTGLMVARKEKRMLLLLGSGWLPSPQDQGRAQKGSLAVCN